MLSLSTMSPAMVQLQFMLPWLLVLSSPADYTVVLACLALLLVVQCCVCTISCSLTAKIAIYRGNMFKAHISNFQQMFNEMMAARPTGRPRPEQMKDFMKMAQKKFADARKALAGQRPTGRPFKPIVPRQHHNMATWKACHWFPLP